MLIEGSVAVVTGAASGLGRATAAALVARGAQVLLIDRDEDGGRAAMEALGAGAHFAAADVCSPAEVRSALDSVEKLGPLRVAVNCAGVVAPGKILTRNGTLPLEDFSRVLAVNLAGTFNVLSQAAERMAETEPVGEERGVIVNTASIAAFDGQVGQPAYAASKGGVAAMTLPAARELARHLIRVVAIAPGIFETPMIAGLPDDVRKSLGSQVPHPSRLGRAPEYADLVMHIIANPMLNGETIRLDGAVRMAPS